MNRFYLKNIIYFNQGYDLCWINAYIVTWTDFTQKIWYISIKDSIHTEYTEGLVTQVIFVSLGRCPQGQHQCYILGKALMPLRGIFLGKWKVFGALIHLWNQTILFQYALIVKKSPKQSLVNLIGHVLESFLMNPRLQGKLKNTAKFCHRSAI